MLRHRLQLSILTLRRGAAAFEADLHERLDG